MARELARRPAVVVAENPTRGPRRSGRGGDPPASPGQRRAGCGGAAVLQRPRRGAGAVAPSRRARARYSARSTTRVITDGDRRTDAGGHPVAGRCSSRASASPRRAIALGIAVLAIGLQLAGFDAPGRARRALDRRLRLLVRVHLGDAGPGDPAHHHRPGNRARLPRRRVQHRRRRTVLRRRDRGDLDRTARRVAPVGDRHPGRAARGRASRARCGWRFRSGCRCGSG